MTTLAEVIADVDRAMEDRLRADVTAMVIDDVDPDDIARFEALARAQWQRQRAVLTAALGQAAR